MSKLWNWFFGKDEPTPRLIDPGPCMPPPSAPDPDLALFMKDAGPDDYRGRFTSAPIGVWSNWQFKPGPVSRITFRPDGTGELLTGSPMGVSATDSESFHWTSIGERAVEIRIWDDGFGPGESDEPADSGVFHYDFVESDELPPTIWMSVQTGRSQGNLIAVRRDMLHSSSGRDDDTPEFVHIGLRDPKEGDAVATTHRDELYPPASHRVRMKVQIDGFHTFGMLLENDEQDHHDLLFLEG